MNMKKYIVGGYVRDQLLGLKPKDRDWVIVGAEESDVKYLMSIGFELIGKDFPVLMSPDGEEYALARTERKNGSGYDGFEFNTNKVTLQEDLLRRDLTINSIAYDPILEIYVDPYGGRADLENKVLKHTSPAFAEDPLRVIRLARFAARYPDFKIHPETMKLAKKLVSSGETKHLSPHRVIAEFKKACSDPNVKIFIDVLNEIGYLKQLLPDVNITQSMMKTLNNISVNATPAYTFDYVWAVILDGEQFTKNHVCNNLPFPESTHAFSQFVEKNNSSLRSFGRMTPKEKTTWFINTGLHNKGGEQFLYKVTEFMMLVGDFFYEQEENILKVHDAFYSAKIPDIQDMVKKGTIKPTEIRDYVFQLHETEVEKLFK